MKIIFAIPTWNRKEQLEITISNIINQIAQSNYECLLIVSDNHSNDGTAEYLNTLQSRNQALVVRPSVHIPGMSNIEFVLRSATNTAEEGDYIWTFGDDDDLTLGAINLIGELLKKHKPRVLSVGNTQLPPHKNVLVHSSVREIARNYGFFLTLCFISQVVYSKNLAKTITDNSLITNKFGYDAYAHGTSILYLGADDTGVYVDAPIATHRYYHEQHISQRKRWELDDGYLKLFRHVISLRFLRDSGTLRDRLDRRYFRYWRWHIWDFFILNASLMSLRDRDSCQSEAWVLLEELIEFIADAELRKRLTINIAIQKALIAHAPREVCLRSLEPYESLHVYQSGLGDF